MTTSSHRIAFPLDKASQKPVKANIDRIINEAALKMKTLIDKRTSIERETDLLIGQEKILKQNIKSTKETIEDKKKVVQTLECEYTTKEKEIAALEDEKKNSIKQFNESEASFKESLNLINQDLNSIEYGTIAEDSQKKSEIKTACEEVLALKADNELLREQLYLKHRELYQLEIQSKNTLCDEEINTKKVQGGIEFISTLYEIQKNLRERREGKNSNEDEEEFEQHPPKMTETNAKTNSSKNKEEDIKNKEEDSKNKEEDSKNKEEMLSEIIKVNESKAKGEESNEHTGVETK